MHKLARPRRLQPLLERIEKRQIDPSCIITQHGILVTTASPTLMRTGSAGNATFKGRHRQEYAWFSVGSGLPIVSMDSDRAARQILEACQAGDSDVFTINLLNPPGPRVCSPRSLPKCCP